MFTNSLEFTKIFDCKLLNKEYTSQPYVIDDFVCSNLNELSHMRFFIRKKLIINEKIDLNEYSEFELESEHIYNEPQFYHYTRAQTKKVSLAPVSWCEFYDLNYIACFIKVVKHALYEKDLSESEYDILFYQTEIRDKNKINIQITGEHKLHNPLSFDYNLGYGNDRNKKEICYPYFCQMIDLYPKYEALFYPTTNNEIKSEFCCFATSNGSCQVRNYFFHYICNNYKLVKSYGALFNNVGRRIFSGWGSKEQTELLGRHKFVLCFENSRDDNDYYITEKIMNAKLSGAVPIYWGTSKCLELFDREAFLYLDEANEYGYKKLLEEIKQLDQDDGKYIKMRNKQLIIPEKIEHMRNKSIRNIIQQ